MKSDCDPRQKSLTEEDRQAGTEMYSSTKSVFLEYKEADSKQVGSAKQTV